MELGSMSGNYGRKPFVLPKEIKKEFLTIKEFAGVCKISTAEVYYLIRTGKIIPDRRFGIMMLPKGQVEKYETIRRS